MRLSSWVKRNRLRQCEAAERLGVSAGYLSELLATEADPNHPRARRCSKRLAKQINERTGGKVGLMDLLYPEARKTRRPKSEAA